MENGRKVLLLGVFIILLMANNTTAQSIEQAVSIQDSVITKKTVKSKKQQTDIALSFAVPSALITYGIVTRFTPHLQQFDHNLDLKIAQKIDRKYTFDDYIQYVPYAAIFGLDLCKVRAKHSFVERTLVVGTAVIIMSASVNATKYLTKIERPDHSNYLSFPSGHTATVFLGAHILFREYKDVSPWIGVTGYVTALTTGSMRMINRKHWFSDVLIGAGIGILSAELSYLMLPVWSKWFKVKSRQNAVVITPSVSVNHFGIGLLCVF
ncbi:MAG: phosphatase PAP2 family protein [Bacteroidales bacterium]|jgi:membrane-associated phospholipid phosphatase|nr:phosphatase PAP2 family protein [Bacteroidales bacterium]